MTDGFIIKGIFTGLTPGEKLYLLLHPHHVTTISRIKTKADQEAARRFPSIEALNDGPGDAFRHCYASAMLARDIGPANARQFTDAHEAWSANPSRSRAMDLHNNAVGIRIGTFHKGSSDTVLASLCMTALNNGELMTTLPATGQAY